MTERTANLTHRLAAYPKSLLDVLRPFRPRALIIGWQVRVLLVLGGTLASLSQFHLANERQAGGFSAHPSVFYCVTDSFIYSFCIAWPLFYVAECCWPYISRLRVPWSWGALFLSITVPAASGTLVSDGLLALISVHHRGWLRTVWDTGHMLQNMQKSLTLSLVFGVSYYLYVTLKSELEATTLRLRTKQLEEERARKLAITAQLASLESRVRPHFLFNTLNSISALVREQPEQAEQMIERLSSLLRFSLDADHHRTVPLRDEVKLARAYLEIEKARFGARLQFSFEIPAELNAVAVPPFALQTLVENSVKYAVSTRRAGGKIHITALTQGDSLLLQVRDDGPGFTVGAITAGHGLDNLQARLVALFAGRATLDIDAEDDATTVTLWLPVSHEAV